MSLVTRCPACATTFKVVRDQLRISDGWVRCGRCSEVFDANVDLHEAPDASAPPEPVPQPEAPPPLPPEGGDSAAASDAEPSSREFDAFDDAGIEESDFLDDEPDAPPPEEKPAAPTAAADAPTGDMLSLGVVIDEPWPTRPLSSPNERPVFIPTYPALPPFPSIDLDLSAAPTPPRLSIPMPLAVDSGHAQLEKALRRARTKSAKIARAKAREQARIAARESAPVVLSASEPEPLVEVVRRTPRFSFGGSGEGMAFWRRFAGRRWMAGAAVVAAVLLVIQVLHQERDLIVARQPALRPLFASLCGLAGCELSALRQIGDITIDGASFAREKSGDAYRLSFTLRNAATVPLAMPAVELSLLDLQERAVVRRVLMPAEFGAPPVLQGRAERAASLAMALTGPEALALPPVAGYRVLAFYP